MMMGSHDKPNKLPDKNCQREERGRKEHMKAQNLMILFLYLRMAIMQKH
jgi:hypothetical protein